jgi:hypothetical protein
MKNKIYRVMGLSMLLISSTALCAGPPSPKPPPPPKLPIDDYIGILVVLSVIYGFYLIYYKLKQKTPR